MSLYDYAFEKFKGRKDVPNIYSMKPRNAVEPYKISFKSTLAKACFLESKTKRVFEESFVDSYEDEGYLDYDCILVTDVVQLPNTDACLRAKRVVLDFETVLGQLNVTKSDRVLLENELLRLYREASIILETSNDLAASVLLEDFIENYRSIITDIIAVRKAGTK